ncbi:MAG: SDR family oxidoreductase [Desulfobacterales bacterium]|nr:SDR family oxidoreductase [Desulfobacterales bacterium]
MNWTGKTVYITGGSSGIGMETARQLLDRGARVALFARGEKNLAAVAEAFRQRPESPEVFYEVMDVSSWKSVEAAVKKTAQSFGPPDVVLNSAGVGKVGYFETISSENFDKVMAINVSGTRNVAEATLPYLKKKKGTLALVSSSAGFIPVFGYSAYGTSKFAVYALAEILRYEMKRFDVTVCLFCPSEVETPMLEAERLVIPKETRALKDFAGVISVDRAVLSLIQGIEKGTYMIIPGFRTKILYWLRRVVPGPIYRGIADVTAMLGASRK